MIKKYLTSFVDDNEYNDFIFSSKFIMPNVSLIKSINKINFGLNNSYEYSIEEIEELKNRFDNCTFMYEDAAHNTILNFKEISIDELLSFNEHNIIPYLAHYIGIYNNWIRVGSISLENKRQDFGERKYRVGLMSDIHYNDDTIDSEIGTVSYDGTEYETDLPNALSVYQNKEDVDFICASGDVSTDSIKHILNFKKMLNENAPTTNFYSCLGNHDFCAISNPSIISPEYNEIGFNVDDLNRLQAWNDILTPSNSKYEINFQDEDTEIGKTSYWFEVPIEGTDKSDIYLFLSVNYGNNSTGASKIIDLGTNGDTTKYYWYVGENPIDSNSNPEIDGNWHLINGIPNHIVTGELSSTRKINWMLVVPSVFELDFIYNNDNENITDSYNITTVTCADGNEYKIFAQIDPSKRIDVSIVGKDKPEKTNDDFPYIQQLVDYVGFMPSKYNLQFYDNKTLIWLKDILETYKDKRIFIFTHQFFAHKAGNNNSKYLYDYGGDIWRITEEYAYCLCGLQFEFLNKLNNEYKNTIWFTGHSHYKWNWQTIDPYINITNNEYDISRPDDDDFNNENRYLRKSNDVISKTGFNVHLPSTSRPLRFSWGYDVAGEDSEGAIMDVYEDYVDIRGIVFKEESNRYINKYHPISQYRINIKAA